MRVSIAKAVSSSSFLLILVPLVLVALAYAPATLGRSAYEGEHTVIDPSASADEQSDSKSKSSKSKKREDDEKEKSSKKDDDDDDDDEKEKSSKKDDDDDDDDEKDKASKKADKLAKSKKQADDDDDDDDDAKLKEKSDKKNKKKDKARLESASAPTEIAAKVERNAEAAPALETNTAATTAKGLSAKSGYIALSDALKRAQAEGGNGDVLQVDLEWDEARSTVTWDLTFSSGTEYEFDAISGKFLGAKAKGTAKLAVLAPLALNDRRLLTFQQIIQKAESEHGQSVMEMELKRDKAQQATRFEVVLADGKTLLYDAATGKALQ
jgi:hypothetical protein